MKEASGSEFAFAGTAENHVGAAEMAILGAIANRS